MTPSVAQQLIDLIRTDVNPAAGADLDASTDLLLTGLVDSLGVVRIVNWIEDELGVDIDPVDVTLDNFQTVAAMAAYVEARQPDA